MKCATVHCGEEEGGKQIMRSKGKMNRVGPFPCAVYARSPAAAEPTKRKHQG